MLLELDIHDLALLRRARLAFAPASNALTGATGAGKSLVLRALALLRGERADKDVVRDGAAECTVSALLRVPPALAGEIARAVAPAELRAGDDPDGALELVLARAVTREGRSRCHANGQLVPLSALRAAGERLVDVLGQGETRRFAAHEARADLLDRFGRLEDLRERYAAALARARELRERRDRLARETRERRKRGDFLRHCAAEIDAAAPRPGESVALAEERALLAAAASLQELCGGAVDALYDADGSVVETLGRLRRRVEAIGPDTASLLERAVAALARADAEIGEATAAFRAVLERAVIDPRREAEVDARLTTLHRLLDRFGPDEAALFAERERIAEELSALERDESDADGAAAALDDAAAATWRAGIALDAARAAAGRKLERAMEKTLAALQLEGARFQVALSPGAPAHSEVFPGAEAVLERAREHGWSAVTFLLAANAGHAARPLETVASGGEFSRIALALRSCLRDVLDTPVLVFDEVESGVGDRLGDAVARVLNDLAKSGQVIVVTHLAAVAARADRHLRVEKSVRDGTTEATVSVLEGDAREAEIAAMLRGAAASEATHAEAKALLATGAPAAPVRRAAKAPRLRRGEAT